MVITDPPYNVPIKGHVSGKGRARHGEFAMIARAIRLLLASGFLAAVAHVAPVAGNLR
jgi:hypothetical protein